VATSACEFLDVWIENGVHASEAHGAVGAEQDISVLTGRRVSINNQPEER
jgi:hypothetical protein